MDSKSIRWTIVLLTYLFAVLRYSLIHIADSLFYLTLALMGIDLIQIICVWYALGRGAWYIDVELWREMSIYGYKLMSVGMLSVITLILVMLFFVGAPMYLTVLALFVQVIFLCYTLRAVKRLECSGLGER